MKLIAIIFAASLSGCAAMTTYIQGHAAQIGAFSVAAAALSSGEGVVVNSLAPKDRLTPKPASDK